MSKYARNYNITNDTYTPFGNKYYDISKKIYDELGPGHSEYIYHRAFEVELRNINQQYDTEKRIIIIYTDSDGNDHTLGDERIDIYIPSEKYLIEFKAISGHIKETEIAQVLKYERELRKANVVITNAAIINFPQAGAKKAAEEIEYMEFIFDNI